MSSKSFIPVNSPLIDGNEKKYLAECIESGWISSEGPFVEKFERHLADYSKRNHGIAVSSGTAALDVAIEVLCISSGDEVIMPTFTIISCIHQIIRVGAKPVLIDSDPVTWNMNINQIEEKITSRTKAIMVVHIYGLPVDLDPILDLASHYGLKVIEDAAEMHGQRYKDKPCGSFGDISTFSFYPNKNITTGEGGMILTNNDKLAEDSRSLRNLCFQPNKRFVHERLGWNYRMTNMQAALGLAQSEQLSQFVERKRIMGSKYTNLLSGQSGIQLPLAKTDYADNIYWVFGIVLDKSLGMNAEKAMKRLAASGVGTRPFFYPLHLQPVLKNKGILVDQTFPVSENLAEQGLYLPSGLNLSESQIERVCECLSTIFNR